MLLLPQPLFFQEQSPARLSHPTPCKHDLEKSPAAYSLFLKLVLPQQNLLTFIFHGKVRRSEHFVNVNGRGAAMFTTAMGLPRRHVTP
jgi:hypothetical protein